MKLLRSRAAIVAARPGVVRATRVGVLK